MTIPEVKLRDPPVPDDLSSLMHSCTGSNCTFCAWRKENPIQLGWERLLNPESSSATLCGVDLTSSQVLDLSTDFLGDELYFPQFDAEIYKPTNSRFL